MRGYELQEEIGAGAYGVIHRAMQPVIDREVAVKIIRRRYANDPAFIRRFEAEAQTIAGLEHPHIVPIYDFWRDPEGAYLVMRLLRGGNLLSALEQGPWSLDQAQTLLDQITPALAAAHNQGVVHRDIKPANILFDESGNAYLSDFGIAKHLQHTDQHTFDGELLETPDYVSPEQIQEGPVSPQSDIYSLGAVLYEILTGEKPFPDVPLIAVIQSHLSESVPLVSESRPDLSPQIDAVIQQATAKDPAARFPDAPSMAEAFRQASAGRLNMATILEQPIAIVDTVNPYKGLRAFQEADALDFYGRDGLTGQLIAQLRDSRFLAVVGPSGSGKSSVVKAGVIPALRQRAIEDSDKWFVAEMTPGTHPLEELELALWPIAVDPPPSLVEPMQRDPRGLLRTIRRILPDEDGAQLLLVIDQFEELWSLTDPDRRQHFLDSLVAALSAPRSPLRVIVTLRADFYDRPLQYPPIAELFKQHTELALPLNRDELTWAILAPARRVGIEFDETVLAAILAEANDQPGALPLLQYALMELFDARSGSKIERQAFDDIGGVLGALPRRADEIYVGLSPAEQAATRQLFLRLVTLGEGVEDTRRRVLLSELETLTLTDVETAIADPSFDDIVNQFGTARLLTFDHDPLTRQPTVEVAHEALLREWGQLCTWLEESRDDVRLQRLLAAATAEWQSAGSEQGYLLHGARLDQFSQWADDTTVALTADERAFLTASVDARQQRQAEEAARQQRELETAQQLAATEHQRAEEQATAAHNLRRRAYFLAAALAAAALLALIALFAGVQANNNAQAAEANANAAATAEAIAQENEAAALAAQAEAVAQAEIARFNEEQAQSQALTSGAREAFSGGDVDLALALAVQAVSGEQPPTEAVRTLNDVAYAPGTRLIYENEDQDIYMDLVEMLPGDSHLISQDSGHTLTVWDPNSREILNQFDTANEDATFRRLENIPDSTYIATSYDNNELIIWDWSTGEKVQTWPDIDMTNPGVLFGVPGGELVVSTIYQGVRETEVDGVPEGFSLTGWDIKSGEQVYRIDGEPGERITWHMSTPDSEMALIATSVLNEEYNLTGESRLLLIDLKTGEIVSEPALAQFSGNNFIESISINPAGDRAFAILTDVDDQSFETGADPSGRTAGSTGVFLSLPAGEVLETVEFDTDVRFSKYSPDGSQIVVMIPDLSQRYFALLDAMTGEQLTQLGSRNDGHVGDVYNGAVAFTPDGKRLVSGDARGRVLLWDLETGEIIQRLLGHGGQSVFSIAVSPDGQTAISNGAGVVGNLRFWDIRQGVTAQVFEEHMTDVVIDVAISPDGTKAISTAYFDPAETGNEAILWDTETFEVIHRLPGFFAAAEFLPDGRSAILGGNATGNDVENPEMLLVHWDLESGAELKRKESTEISEAFDIALSPDGSSLLFGARGLMQQFDVETFTEMTSFLAASEDEWLISVAFNPDGQTAIAGGDMGDLILYSLDTGEEIRRYNQGGASYGLDISADGERFVSGGTNHTAVLWDVASGEAIQTFNGHTSGVDGIAFTPDESQIISASADGTLILWDVATGEALRTFSEHGVYVNQVALSPDGQLAYSASDDGTVIARPIAEQPVEDILAHVDENRVLREFTCVERKQYRILPLCDADGVVPESSN